MQGSSTLKVIAAVLVVICISAFALITYKPGGAALKWQMGDDDPVLRFYPLGDSLYVIGSSNISMVNSTGSVMWSKPFPDTQYSTMGNDGELYLYSRDQGLVAFYPDGTHRAIARFDATQTPVISTTGAIYVKSRNHLMAFDTSGIEMWNITGIVSDPVTDSTGNVYFFLRPPEHLSEVYLYCLSPDGQKQWSILYDKYLSNTGLKAAEPDGIYVYNNFAGEIYHVDAKGNTTWRYYKPYLGEYTLLQDEKDRLYMLYIVGTVHVLNSEGNLVGAFRHEAISNLNMTYKPAVYNNTLYVPYEGKIADTADLYALGLDGSTKWYISVNSSGPAKFYTSDDVTCVTTEIKNGNQVIPVLYVLDRQGNVKYVYHSGDGRLWEQVYTGHDNTIYAKTYGGTLYSLKG